MDNKELLMGQEDYWAGYQASIDKMRNDPTAIEFDKLCFHVFGITEDGKKLLEIFKEQMIFPSVPTKGYGDMGNACIYYEGYKEAFRQLIHATRNYVIRKQAEDEKAIKKASEGAS